MEHWTDGLQNEELKTNETSKAMESPDVLAQTHLDLVASSSKPWLENLSEETRTEENLEALKGFKTYEDLAKEYLKVKAEAPGAPEIPEDPEAYEIPVPEGREVDKKLAGHIKPVFHKAKMTQEQVKILTEGMNEFALKVSGEQAEADKKNYDSAVNALKDEWKGADESGNLVYEKNLEIANTGFAKACEAAKVDVDSDALDKWRNAPDMLRIFHAVGKAVSEGAFTPGGAIPKSAEMTDEEFMKKEVFKGK